MKQAKEKEVALLYLDNNNLKSLNKGLERDIKKLEKLLSLTSDTCEQQVNELMEQQKEIIDLKKHITKRNVIIIELKAKIKTMKND